MAPSPSLRFASLSYPQMPAVAQSQTGDSPHELTDSRVSCELLLRTKSRGICLQIIRGQQDCPGSRSPPLPLARRWKGTRVRTQLPGDADQPGPSLSPATSSDCYKSPIIRFPMSTWIILPTLQDFFDSQASHSTGEYMEAPGSHVREAFRGVPALTDLKLSDPSYSLGRTHSPNGTNSMQSLSPLRFRLLWNDLGLRGRPSALCSMAWRGRLGPQPCTR